MKARPEQAQPTPCGRNGDRTTACPDHRPTLVAVAGTELTYAVCRSCRGATLRSATPEGALAAFEAGWIAYRPEGPSLVPPEGARNGAGAGEGR